MSRNPLSKPSTAGETRPDSAEAQPSTRLTSLDVFRGLTVAGMILVNNPGSWGSIYPPLDHAKWDGWTLADLVFPFFLFIVGVSITFALSKRLDDPEGRRSALFKVFRRSVVIFGLGLFLAKFPFFKDSWREVQDPESWKKMALSIRIPGVLQRIALCYLIGSLIFLNTRVRGQILAIIGILAGYWALMTFVPVPGFGAGDLARGHDVASSVDRRLLAGHIYKPDYDPEGLLSTLPAIATTLLGILVGHWLRSGRPRFEINAGLFVGGTAAVVAGSAWGASFPVNKALWTSSFVLLTGGLATIGLAVCYWLVDLQGYRRWAYPFRVFGGNAIAAYTLAAIGARLLNMPFVSRAEGKAISVHQLYYNEFLLKAFSPENASWPYNASLLYALTFVLACFLIVVILDALGIHIRA